MTTLTYRIELPLVTKLIDLDTSCMGSHNHRVGMDNISFNLVFMPITLWPLHQLLQPLPTLHAQKFKKNCSIIISICNSQPKKSWMVSKTWNYILYKINELSNVTFITFSHCTFNCVVSHHSVHVWCSAMICMSCNVMNKEICMNKFVWPYDGKSDNKGTTMFGGVHCKVQIATHYQFANF